MDGKKLDGILAASMAASHDTSMESVGGYLHQALGCDWQSRVTQRLAERLESAVSREDSREVAFCCTLMSRTGVMSSDLAKGVVDLLGRDALWHHSHEEVLRLVEKLQSNEAVSAMISVARAGEGYMKCYGLESLQRKAVFALWRLGRNLPSARDELRALAQEVGDVADEARRRLEKDGGG